MAEGCGFEIRRDFGKPNQKKVLIFNDFSAIISVSIHKSSLLFSLLIPKEFQGGKWRVTWRDVRVVYGAALEKL